MSSLKEMLIKFSEAKVQADKWKKIADGLNVQIKEEMEKAQLKVTQEGEYKFEKYISSKKKVNEARLIALLKDKGINGAIKMVEAVDEEVVEKAMMEGELLPEEFETCVDVTSTVNLKMTKAKKEEEVN